jgi:hypothetical protein
VVGETKLRTPETPGPNNATRSVELTWEVGLTEKLPIEIGRPGPAIDNRPGMTAMRQLLIDWRPLTPAPPSPSLTRAVRIEIKMPKTGTGGQKSEIGSLMQAI